jgi:hypothetical protein
MVWRVKTTSQTGNRAIRRAAGFTIIEVMVTVVTVFAGLLAIIEAMGAAVTALNVASTALESNLLLKQEMAEIEFNYFTQGKLEPATGRFSGLDAGFQWSMNVEPTPQFGDKQMNRVMLTVWRDPPERKYSVDTYFPGPS